MSGPEGPIGFFLGGLAASAVGSLCAAGDAALVSLHDSRLDALSDGKTPAAVAFKRYVKDPTVVLSRWLVCRVLAIAGCAALFEEAATALGAAQLGPLFAMVGALVTYGTLAEILSSLGRRRPEQVGALALRFLYVLEVMVIPIAFPLGVLGRAVNRRVPENPESRLTETDVQWVVKEGERVGAISEAPAAIIRNALEFEDRIARDIMIPRRKISAIEVTTPLPRVLDLVSQDGHSRYPVFRESIDHILGLLYTKDLFRLVREGTLSSGNLQEMARTPVLFVAETQPIAIILREMRTKRLHMAIVSDEFGGVSGVITLEDIIEEIVGEIRDEYDTDAQIEDLGGGRFVADASVSLAELSALLKREIPVEGGDFESIGGLIVSRTGSVPPVGATVNVDGLKLIVREADARRIMKVEVVPRPGSVP